MEQTAWAIVPGQGGQVGQGGIGGGASVRQRAAGRSLVVTVEVTDPEVVLELRRHEGEDLERYLLTALRLGVLSLRAAGGQIDSGSLREAGTELVSQVRDLLSAR